MIKILNAYRDDEGSIKARMEDFPPEAFQAVYGTNRDKKSMLGITRRCVNYRANSMMEYPWVVERNNNTVFSSEDKNLSNSEFIIIRSIIELIRNVEISLLRFSQAFIDIENTCLLDPRFITIETDKETKEILGYTYKVKESEKKYDSDEIIYINDPDYDDSPMQSIMETIEIDQGTLKSIDSFITSFFANGAIKATIVTVEGFPTEDETKRLERMLKTAVTGVKNAFKNIVLRVPVQSTVIGSGMEDYDPELNERKILDIVTAFEIFPSLILPNASNYATALSDRKEFFSSIMNPRVRSFAKEVNDQWLNLYGYNLSFLPEKLPVMRVDENIRSQSLMNMINAGFDILTAVEILGYDLTDEQKARLIEKSNSTPEQTIDNTKDDLQVEEEFQTTKNYRMY